MRQASLGGRGAVVFLFLLGPGVVQARESAQDACGRPVRDLDGRPIVYAPPGPGAAASAAAVREGELCDAASAPASSVRPVPSRAPHPGVVDPVRFREDASIGSFNQSLGTAGIHTLDVDADGVAEILVGHSMMWYLLSWVPDRGTYEQRHFHVTGPGSTFGGGGLVELKPGDVNDDGVLDVVILLTGGDIEVYDARTGSPVGTQSLGVSTPKALAVGDFDPAPGDEVAVLAGSPVSLSVFGFGVAGALWSVPTGGTDLAFGNVDTDAAIELAVAGVTPGVVVDTVTRSPEWTFPAGFGAFLAVGDIDGDGIDEIAASLGSGDFWTVDGDTQTEKWRGTNFDSNSIAVADTDGDRIGEVLLGDGQWGVAHVFDGPTGMERLEIRNPEHSIANLAAADVDGDCDYDLVWGAGYTSTGEDHLFVASLRTGSIEWQNVESDGPMYGVAVADIDADGSTEVLHLSVESDAGYEGAVVFITDLHHRRTEYISPTLSGGFDAHRAITAAQLDTDPPLEYVAPSRDTFPERIAAYDGVTHQLQWSQSLDRSAVTSLASGDVNDDGQVEVLVGTGTLRILGGGDGAVLWSSLAPPSGVIGDIRIADVDGDGDTEFLYVNGSAGLRVIDGSRLLEEWTLPSTSLRALDVGDVDGDLDLDIVVGDANGVLAAYDGLTHALVFNDVPDVQPVHALRVADLDRDNLGEIVFSQALASPSNTSTVKVLDVATGSILWQSPILLGAAGTASSLLVADADDDGLLEIVVGSNYEVRVFEYADGAPDLAPPVWGSAVGAAGAASITSAVCCPSVDVTWADASDAASAPVSYQVFRSITSGFTPDPSNRIGLAFGTSFRDVGVDAATRYHYVVRAFDRQGNGDANTVEVSALTTDPTPPPAPEVTGIIDPDPCLATGVEVSFTFTGDPSAVTFDLVVDGVVRATDITSPTTYLPSDRLSHMYQVRAVKRSCPIEARSAVAPGADTGATLPAPTITGVSDLDLCATDGVSLSFSHAGFPTSGHYDLAVDGLVVLTPVTSPVAYVPGDDLPHSYVVRAVETGCLRTADSAARVLADANRIPDSPLVGEIRDTDSCSPGTANLLFTHPGFAERGHYELWRDGRLFAAPVVNGSLFTPGDAGEHGYVVRAVDDRCGLSTDSSELRYADGVTCVSLGEPRLYAVKLDAAGVRFTWDPAIGPVASYNLYPGTLAGLRSSGFDHQKTLAGASFPDSPTPSTGCDVAGGAGTTARLEGAPEGVGLYFLLVGVEASGREGPYGSCAGGIDCHDPSIDPRPASFFCP